MYKQQYVLEWQDSNKNWNRPFQKGIIYSSLDAARKQKAFQEKIENNAIKWRIVLIECVESEVK